MTLLPTHVLLALLLSVTTKVQLVPLHLVMSSIYSNSGLVIYDDDDDCAVDAPTPMLVPLEICVESIDMSMNISISTSISISVSNDSTTIT